MTLAEQDAEERIALGYRHEATWFRIEARQQQEAGHPDEAWAALRSAYDLGLLAAAIEKSVRGIEGRHP